MSGDLVSSITQPWPAGEQSPGTMGPWLLSEAGDRDGAGCRWENNVLIREVSTKYRGHFRNIGSLKVPHSASDLRIYQNQELFMIKILIKIL